MKLKTLAVAALTLSMAGATFAQGAASERGGGGMGSGGGSGPVGGSGGSGMGRGNGPAGNGMAGIPGIVVATDGTAFLVRHLEADPVGQFEIVAIRTSGALGWSYKLATLGPASLVVAGTNVVAVQHGQGLGSQGTPVPAPGSAVSKLTALSQASGGVIWTLDVAGNLMDVTPFSGGLYLTVVKPPAGASGTPTPGTGLGEKSLVAVSSDGKILWSVKIN
jgi:hypothetical protein